MDFRVPGRLSNPPDDAHVELATLMALPEASQCESRSLYEEGWKEAAKHRWIESQKHGCDLGNNAIDEWVERYWLIYCKFRRLEHVLGHVHWEEFEEPPSLFISKLLNEHDLLLSMILDRVQEGWENLEVILWAYDWGLNMDDVRNILQELDINRARLTPMTLVS